ncbi:GPH family glycoside/pentoside/hexuronide:cation symporter [Clostridium saccharoperbutylacetonicum]|uniref:Sugar (Glycoside-pentoside-hexuronide) transporter n=2 Tax=Clostridium TaxID=1485 RepID=M1MMP1_9CLOT|nr:MFS transporter [Clostridium saccharoperbutylacetonicum]AGF56006.1 sugar (glycoside-pentoside-hexuronide) transporter [Clostridium saccharoperbutylacetonicum N1-4(HMT)]NRT63255.1 GPH family glycoside/pentoside/hexuronide:cation symporter [Clostridium saccharoperbutylacetonicum]NSB26617.1 GPH family glycoside/pentoside/hexuronide:cation symporter [Clostridium saccharoperbutylacetonicum]NSB45967.1 GPH family glycoside/pentoside/hexuronide:cation symporter [Clostridium saccharoperbutylacetonicu
MNISQATSKVSEKITLKEKMGYATGDLACNFIYQTVSSFLLFFYTDVFGISAVAAGFMFLIVRMIDAVMDPLIGTIVDKTNTKYGRFRPYLLYGAFPFAGVAILCFTTPGFSDPMKLVYAYITYTLLSITYSVVNIPYAALTSAITQDNKEVVSLTSVRMLFSNIGGLIVSFGVPLLAGIFTNATGKTSTGWQITMSIMGVLGALLLIYCFMNTKERVQINHSEEAKINVKDIFIQLKSNRPLVIICLFFILNFGVNSIVNSVGIYYVTYNVARPDLVKWYGLMGTLPALILMPLMPTMYKLMGKKKLLFTALSLKAIGLIALFLVPPTMVQLVFAGRLIAALGTITAGAFTWALIPETIDYGQYKTGKRASGVIYALVGFFFKFGMAIGGIVPGLILANFGYVANQAQTATALHGILLTMTVIPVIFVIIELAAIFFYNLDEKEHKRVLSELNNAGM